MKPYLILSLIIHSLLIGGLVLSSDAETRQELYPRIYRVNLVSAVSPPPKIVETRQTPPADEPTKLVYRNELKPEGITIQKKTKTVKRQPPELSKSRKSVEKPSTIQQPQSNYPDFLDEIDFGSEFGGIKIDGANFQSPYYINLVFSKIRSRWVNPVRLSTLIEVTVYFRVEANGRIVDAEIENSSGITAFDQSALRAILTSDPLPPLPQEFTGDHIGIHLKFEYTP